MLKNSIKLKWKIGFDNLDKITFCDMWKLIDYYCEVLDVFATEIEPNENFWSDVFIVEGKQNQMTELTKAIAEKVTVDWTIEPF